MENTERQRFDDTFAEGHAAYTQYIKGVGGKNNPYPINSIEYDGWVFGWKDRQRDLSDG